ncbi:MAG: ABC transporter permease [Sedimentisphaerales bacterium]|nr:ABC transporter permease [Sedimentisphaerales bacterium]
MRWFGVKRTVKLGTKSLLMHGLRSTLTTLGIVFGVSSVIAMLAIGEGASRQAQAAIAELGSTNLIIETVKPPEEKTDTGNVEFLNKYGLTYTDVETIRNTIPDIEVTVPIRQINQEARYQIRPKVAIRLIGTIPWYTEISPINLIRGRFLSSTDINYRLSVCVLDDKVAQELFAFEYPMGKHVRIQGNYYRVVGIVAHSSSGQTNNAFGSEIAKASDTEGGVSGNIYIPLTTAKCRFPEFNYQFSGGSASAEKVELQKITVKLKSIDQVLSMRDILDTLLSRLHEGKKDYDIVVPLELLRQTARTRRIFSIVLGSIAAISLLVGGIGIMNIMLATVSERTREIGIRRALGARKSDIILQFLSETLLLTLIGGILGIILGSAIPMLVTRFSQMPTVITPGSLILAFGISAIVGLTFGLYPAYRAANMDPIESLRHE